MMMRTAGPAVVLAMLFGAVDQFLGARGYVLGFWVTEASLLSAPWLLVAFCAGWSQPTAKRAMLLGFVCTFAALAGYWAMTLSPVEGVQLSTRMVRGLLRSQGVITGGAVVTGPLFGLLGHRWRTRRDWWSAFFVAFAVCCEPLAHAAYGDAFSFRRVWPPEVAAGLLMVTYVGFAARRRAVV